MIRRELSEKCEHLEPLGAGELRELYETATLSELGMAAHRVRMRKADPGRVTYIVDRNINYTNLCVSGCRFCAFYKPPGHKDGYVISKETLSEKIREAQELGAVQILLQGGMNPDLGLGYYTDLLSYIRENHGIHVHGFSPPEIMHLAALEKMSLDSTLKALIDAGLHSIPGGGAEILADSARSRVSPRKCSTAQWLEVMRTAHGLGMKTTATMMFGHGESLEERIGHLMALRSLQHETRGFTAFIPWSFQPGNTELARQKTVGGHEYLAMLALSRIALHNFPHIQLSWVTQGARVGQVALFFGADDFGSTMIEENVVAAAGVAFRMDIQTLERLIRSAGFEPCRRNQAYELLPVEGKP
ncbi:MAG: cyclic dehypoxanthinyl futalosine synthase [Planctomycetota bacterium]